MNPPKHSPTSATNDSGVSQARRIRKPPLRGVSGGATGYGTRHREVKGVGRFDDRHYDPVTGRRL